MVHRQVRQPRRGLLSIRDPQHSRRDHGRARERAEPSVAHRALGLLSDRASGHRVRARTQAGRIDRHTLRDRGSRAPHSHHGPSRVAARQCGAGCRHALLARGLEPDQRETGTGHPTRATQRQRGRRAQCLGHRRRDARPCPRTPPRPLRLPPPRLLPSTPANSLISAPTAATSPPSPRSASSTPPWAARPRWKKCWTSWASAGRTTPCW